MSFVGFSRITITLLEIMMRLGLSIRLLSKCVSLYISRDFC